MADTNQGNKAIDLDTLTDEQVLQLKPEEIESLIAPQSSSEENTEETNIETTETSTTNEGDNGTGNELPFTETNSTETENGNETKTGSEEETTSQTKTGEEGSELTQEKPPVKSDPITQEKTSEKEEVSKPEVKKEVDSKGSNQAAIDFYNKVSAPFKADGKEIQVRSAEDAIRFMQMGVNYSRRMQEMKPIRAMNAMLTEHGLSDAGELSFLIDIKNGKLDAIKDLLQRHKIDPMDLSVEEGETPYKRPNYSLDPRTIDFKDVVDNTASQEGGPELIRDINSNWDELSKQALSDQPGILPILLEQKNSGVYDKVVAEVVYQRTAGYLTDVPFLQAYRDVSHAMDKNGLLPKPTTTTQIQSSGVSDSVNKTTPIDTGIRKVVQKKSEPPNPNLSSTPLRPTPNKGVDSTLDYSTMSDEDFLKLPQPA